VIIPNSSRETRDAPRSRLTGFIVARFIAVLSCRFDVIFEQVGEHISHPCNGPPYRFLVYGLADPLSSRAPFTPYLPNSHFNTECITGTAEISRNEFETRHVARVRYICLCPPTCCTAAVSTGGLKREFPSRSPIHLSGTIFALRNTARAWRYYFIHC